MTTLLTSDAAHVIVPWRPDLASLVPHAREFDYRGQRMMVLPNGRDEARVARNLGLHFPSPILTRYGWMGSKPWDIQRTTAAMLAENERAYVLSTMGTGKTRSVLYAADYLLSTGQARRVLVVAPLSTLTPVWEAECFALMMKRTVRVLYGDRAKRLKLLKEPADIYIVNHHGLALLQHELVAKGFDVVVIDEIAAFRNKSTRLWKSADAVVNAPTVKWAWGLTGSPTPQSPVDAWAQVRLLTPNRTVRSKTSFQDLTMRKVSAFRWVPRPEANDIVFAAMQPSVRFTLDDVMELPPTIYVDRQVTLDQQAQQAYSLLISKMRILTQHGKSITAANEGVLQSKLLQVACGFIYTDDKNVYQLPATARLQALDETIAETDRKVIVFVPFLHALSGVADHLRAQGHNVGVVHGGTSRTVRDRIFTNFQNHASPRILVAHPQCMAHGLTLTSANCIIWYSPTSSLEIYEQANARIVRPGQKAKTLIVHLSGTMVEKLVYQRLKQKARMQGLLLKLFDQQELEF
jgi:SNF2 family DNA or RNA helicase